jgi:hypothetical protein
MLVIQPLTPELQATGKRLVCPTATGAGAGEIDLLGARQGSQLPFLPAEPPADHRGGHRRFRACEAYARAEGRPGRARRCTRRRGK